MMLRRLLLRARGETQPAGWLVASVMKRDGQCAAEWLAGEAEAHLAGQAPMKCQVHCHEVRPVSGLPA